MKSASKFKCRIEELPFLSLLVLDSFNRDKNDFVEFSQEYNDPFVSDFLKQQKIVEKLAHPEKLTGELKKNTSTIKVFYRKIRNMVNKAERYVSRAQFAGQSLTVAPSDFGFKPVRDQIRANNAEGVVKNLRDLKNILMDNKDILESKGFTVEVKAELDALLKSLIDQILAGTRKKKERAALVLSNLKEMNQLWFLIYDLLKTGKTIYKEKDRNKVKDYTYERVIKNVRLKRSEKKINGTPDISLNN